MYSQTLLNIGSEIVAKVDSIHTGIFSIYHVHCEVLISSSTEPPCANCKKHRRSLTAMISHVQKDERTHPSSHTNYSYLSTLEKNEHLRHLHTESKIAKSRISHLQRNIMEVTNDDGVILDEDLHDDVKQILADATEQINISYQPNSFQYLFWEQQKKAGSSKNACSMKWHPLLLNGTCI